MHTATCNKKFFCGYIVMSSRNVLNYLHYSKLHANTAPNFNGLEKMPQKLPSIADPISKKCNIFEPYRTFLVEVQSFSKACIQDVLGLSLMTGSYLRKVLRAREHKE